MVKRNVTAPDTEPEQMSFTHPSQKEHLFQVSDIYDYTDPKFNLDENTVCVKLEVVGGEEEGRSLLQRLSLDGTWKGFFATRLFLKAIALPHKGQIEIDTEDWQGKQFYATVVHNPGKKGKVYANIGEYNFDKIIEEVDTKPDVVKPVDKEVAWDE